MFNEYDYLGAFIPNENRDRLAVHYIFNWLLKANQRMWFPSLALGRDDYFALAIAVQILFVRNEQKDWNVKRDPFSGITPKSFKNALKSIQD